MRIPARHPQIMQDDKWQDAFGRRDSVQDVLKYVREHWQRLQRRPPPDMHYGKPEPNITKRFRMSLRANARNHGITGFFAAEDEVGLIEDEAGEVKDKGRTDILYHSDRIDPPLELIFEFKKLKFGKGSEDARVKYWKSGIMRFVDGKYARSDDLAFMVGLVPKPEESEPIVAALKSSLQMPDAAAHMRAIKNQKGKYLTAPPIEFPKLTEFETRHARDHVENCPDILLGHIFLPHKPD